MCGRETGQQTRFVIDSARVLRYSISVMPVHRVRYAAYGRKDV